MHLDSLERFSNMGSSEKILVYCFHSVPPSPSGWNWQLGSRAGTHPCKQEFKPTHCWYICFCLASSSFKLMKPAFLWIFVPSNSGKYGQRRLNRWNNTQHNHLSHITCLPPTCVLGSQLRLGKRHSISVFLCCSSFNFSHLCFFILQNFEGHFNCTLIYKLLTWPHSASHSRLDVRLSISAFVLWKRLISNLLSVECSTNEISDWEKDFFIWNYFPQRTNVGFFLTTNIRI